MRYYRVWVPDESGTIEGTSYACTSAEEANTVTRGLRKSGFPNAIAQQSETGEDGTWSEVKIG